MSDEASLQIQHSDGAHAGAFFIERGGERIAEMTYARRGPSGPGASLINIDHTLVNPVLRGQGVARKLLDALVTWARATGTRVTATCSYAVGQFAQDESIRDVMAG